MGLGYLKQLAYASITIVAKAFAQLLFFSANITSVLSPEAACCMPPMPPLAEIAKS